MTVNSGLLNHTIRDKAQLYAAYMPFIKNGGIFVPTTKGYALGAEVFLVLTLLEERLSLVARVVWITPKGAQGNRTAGVGLQFADKGAARDRIETLLAASLKAERPTETL